MWLSHDHLLSVPSENEGNFALLIKWANDACGSSWWLSFSNASSFLFCLLVRVASSSIRLCRSLLDLVLLLPLAPNRRRDQQTQGNECTTHWGWREYTGDYGKSSKLLTVYGNWSKYFALATPVFNINLVWRECHCFLFCTTQDVMGCDGGSIPRRDEMVKLKKKAEKVKTLLVGGLSVLVVIHRLRKISNWLPSGVIVL